MSGAIQPLPQHALMAWCSVKVNERKSVENLCKQRLFMEITGDENMEAGPDGLHVQLYSSVQINMATFH
jgi:hypothetical protein